MLKQVGDPLAVFLVGLLPRQSFDMLSVRQQKIEIWFQYVPDCFQYTPVDSIAT